MSNKYIDVIMADRYGQDDGYDRLNSNVLLGLAGLSLGLLWAGNGFQIPIGSRSKDNLEWPKDYIEYLGWSPDEWVAALANVPSSQVRRVRESYIIPDYRDRNLADLDEYNKRMRDSRRSRFSDSLRKYHTRIMNSRYNELHGIDAEDPLSLANTQTVQDRHRRYKSISENILKRKK